MPGSKPNLKIDRAATAGIWIWLAVQLAALGLCGARVALWARSAPATEQTALAIMLAIQIAVSALIFPYLLGSIHSTTLAVASAWTLGMLASFLSDASLMMFLRGETYVTIWLISLHLWRRVLTSPGAKLLGPALASAFALGGPLLWYLRMEFSPNIMRGNSDSIAVFGPLAGAVFQTFPQLSYGSWVELGLLFACGATACMVTKAYPRHT